MKENPPLAPWTPENPGLHAYCLISGAAILIVTVGKAHFMDVGYGVLFVSLSAGGFIHALWRRRRRLAQQQAAAAEAVLDRPQI